MTPVCSPCQAKGRQCVYSSDPSVSRFAALKSEYDQTKTSLKDLSTIYERLKHGSASEASRLLERIRTEDGIPGLLDDRGSPRRSGNDHQLGDYNIEPVDESEEFQTGFHAESGRETALRPKSTLDVSAMPQWTRPTDPSLFEGSEKHDSFPLSPIDVLQCLSLDDFQTSASSQRFSPSHISVSHRVLLWPGVVGHMKRSGLAATVGLDLQCISRNGSPWLLQRKT